MDKTISTYAQNNHLFQTDFTIEEFSNRRTKVFDRIEDDAIVLLQGASPTGEFDIFRQLDDFYYLCGVEVPYSYLLLNGKNRKTILYLPACDPQQERNEGKILNSDDTELVKTLTGVDEVRKLETFYEDINGAKIFYTLQRLWHHGSIPEPLDAQMSKEKHFINQLKAQYPNAEFRDLSPIINPLRNVKSDAEIRLMRIAGQLTAQAVTEAMRCTKPGVIEYQLGAVAEYIFLVNGARGSSYRPIIAGGANAWHGHYYRNNCRIQEGDLLLMDCAPDYRYYTSDIGRMFPVSGKYSPWQRELYGFIVEYHKVLLSLIRPGVLASQIMDEAAQEMKKVFEKTKFSKSCYEDAARQTLEFRGHLSHGVGLTVHDVGNYYPEPLIPGTVFAIDPQMWIPEEQLYIRSEDTVVVTQDGIENLTKLAPLELDDIEKVMKEDGIMQMIPLYCND